MTHFNFPVQSVYSVVVLVVVGVRGSSRWRGRISFHHSSPGSQEGADFDRRKQELAKCHLRITFREYFHNPMKYEGESDWTMCTMQTQIRDLRYLSDNNKKPQILKTSDQYYCVIRITLQNLNVKSWLMVLTISEGLKRNGNNLRRCP